MDTNDKNTIELFKDIEKLEQEIVHLKMKNAMNAPKNTNEIRVKKNSIAVKKMMISKHQIISK